MTLAAPLLVLFLALVPAVTVLWHETSGHDGARIAQLAVALACAGALALSRPSSAAIRLPGALFIGLAGLLAAGSIASAPDTVHALREGALLIGLIPVALAASALLRTRPQVALLVCALASAVYATVVVAAAIALQLSHAPLELSELFIGYDNRRFYNHVQTVALPLTCIASFAAVNGRLRWLAWLGGVGGASLLWAAGGRATALALTVAVVAALLVFRRGATVPAARLGAMLAAGGVVFAAIFVLLPMVLEGVPPSAQEYRGDRLSSDQSRLMLWDIALTQIAQSPWWGIGPMHYAHWPNAKAAHPHNIYLQVAAEWGLPMFLLLAGWAGRALVRFGSAVRHCSSEAQRRIGIGLFMAWVAVAVDSAFSGNLVMPVSQVWIACAAGWAWSWWLDNAPRGRVGPELLTARLLRRFGYLLLLLSQLWLCWSIWPEVVDLAKHIEQTMATVPNDRTNPRFWSHGWF